MCFPFPHCFQQFGSPYFHVCVSVLIFSVWLAIFSACLFKLLVFVVNLTCLEGCLLGDSWGKCLRRSSWSTDGSLNTDNLCYICCLHNNNNNKKNLNENISPNQHEQCCHSHIFPIHMACCRCLLIQYTWRDLDEIKQNKHTFICPGSARIFSQVLSNNRGRKCCIYAQH